MKSKSKKNTTTPMTMNSAIDYPLPPVPSSSSSNSSYCTAGSHVSSSLNTTDSYPSHVYSSLNALDTYTDMQPFTSKEIDDLLSNSLYVPSDVNLIVPSNSSCIYIQDPMSYILETYDHLISPQLQHPPESTSSIIAIRRFLYRKLFMDEALKLLVPNIPINTVEQLVSVTQNACIRCGITLI